MPILLSAMIHFLYRVQHIISVFQIALRRAVISVSPLSRRRNASAAIESQLVMSQDRQLKNFPPSWSRRLAINVSLIIEAAASTDWKTSFAFAHNHLYLIVMASPNTELLEQQLRLLNLLSPGAQIERFSGSAENSLTTKWRHYFLATLLPAPTHTLPQIEFQIWRILGIYEGDFSVIRVDDDTFALRFRTEDDKERLKLKQPLIIFNSILLFAEWDGMTDYHKVVLDEFLTWVQIQIANSLLLTPEVALDFFSNVGKLPTENADKVFYCKYGQARAKLIIKSSEPLVTVAIKQNLLGEAVGVFFKFEKIKSVCYICGRLDHTLNQCALRGLPQFKNMAGRQFVEGKFLWGPHVFAKEWVLNRPLAVRTPPSMQAGSSRYFEEDAPPSPPHLGSMITQTLRIDNVPYGSSAANKRKRATVSEFMPCTFQAPLPPNSPASFPTLD